MDPIPATEHAAADRSRRTGAPLTLYGMSSPNVLKVMLLLEELGLAYEFVALDLIGGALHAPEFRALAPHGKVPVLVEHRAGGDRALFESGAILIDLAERHGAFIGSDADSRSQVIQWLMFQMSAAGPMFGQAIHFNFATKGDSYGRRRFTNELDRLLAVIEAQLGQSPFLAGTHYSIADMALWPWIRTLKRFFPDRVAGPHVVAWFAGLADRPATRRAIELIAPAQAADAQSMRSATPEQLDRYFGRTAVGSSGRIG